LKDRDTKVKKDLIAAFSTAAGGNTSSSGINLPSELVKKDATTNNNDASNADQSAGEGATTKKATARIRNRKNKKKKKNKTEAENN